MNRYAMVFAAGKGTRLGKISEHTPKALLQIDGKPLIYYILTNLYQSGFTHVVVNLHHHRDQVQKFLAGFKISGFQVLISDESDALLETGGGLKFAKALFNDAKHILLHNVDIISDIKLEELFDVHCASKNIATLAVRNRQTSRYFLFDDQLTLKGWTNTSDGEMKKYSDAPLRPLAFSGIHVISSELFELMPDKPVFSMTDLYLHICRDHAVKAWVHDQDLWIDVGRPEHFEQAAGVLYKIQHRS